MNEQLPLFQLYEIPGVEVRVNAVAVREPGPLAKIDSPQEAVAYWQKHVTKASWYSSEREALIVLCLASRFQIAAFHLVSLGTLNQTIMHPRDVFRPAIALSSLNIVVMHNHPSGDPSPSEADGEFTERLAKCGSILQIELRDSIVVGEKGRFFSFKEKVKSLENASEALRKPVRRKIRPVDLAISSMIAEANRIVSSVWKLQGQPNEVNLAEARRSSTRLHQSLHAADMLRKVAHA